MADFFFIFAPLHFSCPDFLYDLDIVTDSLYDLDNFQCLWQSVWLGQCPLYDLNQKKEGVKFHTWGRGGSEQIWVIFTLFLYTYFLSLKVDIETYRFILLVSYKLGSLSNLDPVFSWLATQIHTLIQAGDNLQLNNVLEEKHQNGVIIVVVNNTSSFNDRWLSLCMHNCSMFPLLLLKASLKQVQKKTWIVSQL